jgi:hypothetical protein
VNTNFIREQVERYTGKITPAKALAALIALWLVIRALGFILSLFDAVLPFAVLGLLAYFGYQFLQSSSPAAEQIKSRIQSVTTRRESAEVVSNEVIERITKRTEAPIEAPAVLTAEDAPRIETVNVLADESAETVVDEVASEKMQVAERINPKTGLREPDLARLEEREKEKPSQDNVLSQLEERKKRLRGGSTEG